MSELIDGKIAGELEGTIVGTFMNDRGAFIRFLPYGKYVELEIKVTREQFHIININKPAKIIVEIVV